MNVLLFAYGTLQDEDVQNYVFQRKLAGEPDSLPRFEVSSRKIYGSYLVLENTGVIANEVAGMAYVLQDDELHKADVYEGPAYKRIEVTLKSGREAWVYVEKDYQEN